MAFNELSRYLVHVYYRQYFCNISVTSIRWIDCMRNTPFRMDDKGSWHCWLGASYYSL